MKGIMIAILILLGLIVFQTQSRGGLDVFQPLTDGVFSCFAQNGATFAIIQAYKTYGGINPDAVQNLKTARNRGFATDIYMSVCTAKDALNQVNQMMDAVPDSLYDKVWIRVEPNPTPGCGWTSNTPEKSCQYLKNLTSAVTIRGKDVGIYSYYGYWNQTFQNPAGCPDVSNYLLWYQADDSQARFTNFFSFGGWKTPSIKSFSMGASLCGTQVNLDYKSS